MVGSTVPIHMCDGIVARHPISTLDSPGDARPPDGGKAGAVKKRMNRLSGRTPLQPSSRSWEFQTHCYCAIGDSEAMISRPTGLSPWFLIDKVYSPTSDRE